MFSKNETREIKERFWTTFGQFMKPILSADALPINWVNYKTGVKHMFFRLDVVAKEATISIEIKHPDAGIRQLYFQQLLEYKNMFEAEMGTDYIWQEDYIDEFGKQYSRIYKNRQGYTIFNTAHWHELIPFFKKECIAFDAFWTMVKPVFEDLG